MSRGVGSKTLIGFLIVLLLSPTAAGHEQETLNVIIVEDEARPGNVTDSAFVEGNSVVFRMRDNTENASMRISIDNNQDGNFSSSSDNVSTWLTRTCELDENGSLVDEFCAVSYERIFNATSQGTYLYQVERKINQTLVETWRYNITVHPDVHTEPGQPSIGDCFGADCGDEVLVGADDGFEIGRENILIAVMIFAAFGTIMLALSIRKERHVVESDLLESE
jgi:hypothetical protein